MAVFGLILAGASAVVNKVEGSKKTDAQKASDFTAANFAEIQAGNNAPGKGLNALQYRASPTYPWMQQQDTRGIMLQEVSQVVSAGYAKASDFAPSIAQAAGLVPGASSTVPGNAVSGAGQGTGLMTAAAAPTLGGVSIWWIAGLGALAFGVIWYMRRKR